ncbi:hypothetical protein C8A01DRAFT_45172 [Parachaetomium inaequale]|uniref:F-box domain-containing protein n=1 Tax=Parachaetomium inaequale TaxID=2588326 RepID=A0AAN6PNH5_9PEZI|nr:hypothetical protein C8A01DRAFT_45172 [Parachaetomium inaequale]
MTAVRFDDLPVETLSSICEYLGHSHPSSVLSFALANKHCYSVATAVLYRTIAIKACHAEELIHDAQQCEHLLRRDSAFRHVRRLVVYGRLVDPAEAVWYYGAGQPLGLERVPCEKLMGSPYEDDEQTIEYFVASLGLRPLAYESGKDRSYFDLCWRSLCRLIELLPALTDFVFASTAQLPPCLLETLHKHFAGPRPNRLRLHVSPFFLRSLDHEKLDRDELSLASSPLLHRVWVLYEDTNGYDGRGMPSYHGDAVMDLVRGLAPNLKDASMFHEPGVEAYELGIPLPPRPAWKGFPEGTLTLGSLQSLELDGMYTGNGHSWPRDLSQHTIQRWAQCTDLSVLQTLKLRQIVRLEALAFLTDTCTFPNLTSLTIEYAGAALAGPESAELLQKFLSSLPNLRSLELFGMDPAQTLDTTAFNPRLQRLRLPNALGTLYHRHLPALVQRCPLLEDLAVAVPRSRGSAAHEVRLYGALGSLPRLRRLALTLDASCPTPETQSYVPASLATMIDDLDATFTEGGLEGVPRRAVFNTLVDCAVDEALAVAIFRAISRGKQGSTASGVGSVVVPLEQLNIRVVGGGGGYASEAHTAGAVLAPYLRDMARSWRVDRDIRDDRDGGVCAVEMGMRPRLGRVELQDYWPRGGQQRSECPVLGLFRQI